MAWSRTVWMCLVAVAACAVCLQALELERLPRHIPRHQDELQDAGDDEDSFGAILDKKRLSKNPSLLSTQSWRTLDDSKRKRDLQSGTSEQDRNELAAILQDDHEPQVRRRTMKRSPREDHEQQEEQDPEQPVDTAANKDFQDWLRREYYRNMAKSFASMRKKRDSPSRTTRQVRKQKRSSASSASFAEITDNLRAIEDQLFQDALQAMRDDDEDASRQSRITNDLSLAYDLETMREAFLRLRKTLAGMQRDSEMEDTYRPVSKRTGDCPALDEMTSDCSALSDIMSDGPMKRLLRRACNWHEVCYTCGKLYGLTSDNCDGSFVEQTQTICQGDEPCESTASLLVLPLRQRRIFYKRSNPGMCADDPCIEAYLREGLAAMDEGQALVGRA